MKYLIIFALALTTASAFTIPSHLYFPVIEAENDGRITNGETAKPGEFPYQAALNIKMSVISSSFCGGSLISDEYILTAAHCTDS